MSLAKKIGLISLLLLAYVACAWGSTFTINKVRVIGLQRISVGTVLSYMPVQAGDKFDTSESTDVIKALYKTGFFSDVDLYRRGNDLIVKVIERPTISSLTISGNKKIKTKDLNTALKSSGIDSGRVFNNSTLSQIKQALLAQYYNLGHYNVQVTTSVIPVARNRVAVDIIIAEGPVAKIRSINIVGNQAFTDEELKHNFTLSRPTIFTIFNNNDLYSKQKLDADLENLRSFYLNRGYLEFKIDSSQVSITPDKQNVYIIIHITEGPVYKVSSVRLSGNLLGKKAELQKLIGIESGDVFSRQTVMQTVDSIKTFYGDYGYAFPNIDPKVSMDRAHHLVALNFVVQPSRRIYVRRINFFGNTKTADYVMRREMRQAEGGQFALSHIQESTRRLYNLGYLKDIQSNLEPVSGHPDQVDLDYKVKEASSATASAQVGYSDSDGFIYGGSVNEYNFMGTGKSVGVSINNSEYSQVYSASYYNPYFTTNNIGFGVNAFAQRMKPSDDVNMSSYSENNLGGTGTFYIPMSEHSNLSFGAGYEHPELKLYSDSAQEYKNFVQAHGTQYDLVELKSAWTYSNLDRMVFPTDGFKQSLGGELSVPVFSRSLGFYKLHYEANWYYPLVGKYLVLDTHLYLGYGGGYGRLNQLPFFENYYAGGLGTVRGYQSYSLGPHDLKGNATGGNVSTNGSIGLIFPNPFGQTVRTTAFFDAGNIYATRGVDTRVPGNFNGIRPDQLRYSFGVQVEWRTPFAPLVFSLAEPLRLRPSDQKEMFQFQLGASF